MSPSDGCFSLLLFLVKAHPAATAPPTGRAEAKSTIQKCPQYTHVPLNFPSKLSVTCVDHMGLISIVGADICAALVAMFSIMDPPAPDWWPHHSVTTADDVDSQTTGTEALSKKTLCCN
jgi:hypothetical protein